MKKWKLGNLCTAALVVFVATNLCRHAVASSGPGLLGDHPGTGIFLSRLLKKCPENFRIIGYGETRNMVKMGNTEDRAAIKIHAGDLIFQTAMTSEFDEAVAQSGTASGSVTHVGIFCLPDTVIETNDYGVVRTDICKFLKGANRNILVRVKNGAIAGLAVERAESFLGEPYNESFSPEPGNGFYC
ncbi:MAG: hypothetical protein LBI29_02930, partial [Rickettsiales bacterium]|nr:hypothetical protein [Rickettsiales bacterium]